MPSPLFYKQSPWLLNKDTFKYCNAQVFILACEGLDQYIGVLFIRPKITPKLLSQTYNVTLDAHEIMPLSKCNTNHCYIGKITLFMTLT